MKNVGRRLAIASMIAVATSDAAFASPCALAPAAIATSGLASLKFPSFCDVPMIPTNIRSAEAFKTEVVDTRLAGAATVRATAPDSFTLADTDTFAEAARSAATPPAPMTAPESLDTESFAAGARAKATPPRHARRR